ncbi:MAG: GIY-YIG nuclease family protein [Cyanobacteria bacterium J06627_28]
MTIWSLYLIRTGQNTLYTGITTNVQQRLSEHQQGKKGAKYLRSKGPLQLVYEVALGTRSLASKAEYRLKKLPRPKKEQIILDTLNKDSLLALLKIEDS